jgi:hypothetical protein
MMPLAPMMRGACRLDGPGFSIWRRAPALVLAHQRATGIEIVHAPDEREREQIDAELEREAEVAFVLLC